MPSKTQDGHGNSIKNDDQYEALRDKGMSKEEAARIANSDSARTGRKGGNAPPFDEWTKADLFKTSLQGAPMHRATPTGQLPFLPGWPIRTAAGKQRPADSRSLGVARIDDRIHDQMTARYPQ